MWGRAAIGDTDYLFLHIVYIISRITVDLDLCCKKSTHQTILHLLISNIWARTSAFQEQFVTLRHRDSNGPMCLWVGGFLSQLWIGLLFLSLCSCGRKVSRKQVHLLCQLYLFWGNVTPETDKWKRGMNLTYELSGWGQRSTAQRVHQLHRHTQVSACRPEQNVRLAWCVSLFSRQITSFNVWRRKCQGMRKCVQIQCMHLAVNSMKALLLSRASSHLQAFCHQQVWLSFWSSEIQFMKLHFYNPDSEKTGSAFYSDSCSIFRLAETKFN